MTPPTFTPRQAQLVYLLAAGYDRPRIASSLNIAPRTVKAHLDEIRRRLGVKTAAEIPFAYMAATGDDPYPRTGEPIGGAS